MKAPLAIIYLLVDSIWLTLRPAVNQTRKPSLHWILVITRRGAYIIMWMAGKEYGLGGIVCKEALLNATIVMGTYERLRLGGGHHT